jgi:hypothetical protein
MKNPFQINNSVLTINRRRKTNMKIKNTLNIIIGIAFCVFPTFTRAQCGLDCDNNFNTALGEDSGLGLSQNVAVGQLALAPPGRQRSCVAVGRAALANSGNGSFQTAVGAGAVQFNTGSNNTGVGYEALYGVGGSSSGSNNTATGYEALHSNTTGGSNTASGYEALFFNTSGNLNTATGRGALFHNTTANNNVATGYQALNSNQTGTANTATGTQALQKNTASGNTGDGYQALNANKTGGTNTAAGYQALLKNTTGSNNIAFGAAALESNTDGSSNTAIGGSALFFATGDGNIALGLNAGTGVFSGSNNIDIDNAGANESSTIRIGTSGRQTNTYIAGISGVTVAGGTGVIVDSSGHLGTITSSARYKENIQPMDKASEAVLELKPVTFRYKHELDPAGIPQFGLVAEQVEKVDPDLVARDDQGKPYSVRYEAVNAMLLNEFLKERKAFLEEQRKAQELEANAARQEKQIEALTAGLQKVSAQIELRKPAPQTVLNSQ